MANKITAEMLTFIISVFCQVKDPSVKESVKLDCIDYMVNCSVIQDGYSTNEVVNQCKTEYADIEVRNKRAKNWR